MLLFLYCSSWSIGTGQSAEKVSISDQSLNKYVEAIISGDYSTTTAMTHPRVVELAGGEKFFISQVAEEQKMYNGINLRLLNIVTDQPSPIVEAGQELHALIPYTAEYDNGGNLYHEKNYFLAASLDGGIVWYFLDFKKYDVESIKVFLPDYNSSLDTFFHSDIER